MTGIDIFLKLKKLGLFHCCLGGLSVGNIYCSASWLGVLGLILVNAGVDLLPKCITLQVRTHPAARVKIRRAKFLSLNDLLKLTWFSMVRGSAGFNWFLIQNFGGERNDKLLSLIKKMTW